MIDKLIFCSVVKKKALNLQREKNNNNHKINIDMTNVTDTSFDGILSANAVCVIDFSATWCGPCKKIAPIIEELAKDYDGRAFLGKVDVDEATEITERFEIRNVPTILFFKNGELQQDRVIGAIDKSSLENKIKALL
jgi:thioredoxin 1